MKTYKSFRITANRDTLPTILQWLESSGTALDLAPRLVSRLQLVAEELFLNTLEHGHRQSSDSPTPVNLEVMVDLEVLEDKVSLTYTDHTPAFNPLVNPPGHSTLETTGVGLLLIRRLPDYTHYKRITDTSGNQVKMLFYLAPRLTH